MTTGPTGQAQRVRPKALALGLVVGGSVLLWALYTAVFIATTGEAVVDAMLDAFANVLPLALLSIAAHALLRAHVLSRSVAAQAGLHVGLAVAFATVWYATVLVMLAFITGLRGHGFGVSGFSGPAFTWQVFQGLIVYAGVAATSYALRDSPAAGVSADPLGWVSAPVNGFDQYLIRQGDAIVPIQVRDIVTIVGAQDYSEVATHAGRHLVRMSLAEFERRLDPARFVRVHRSTIIHFSHFVRAEAIGGGRMLAHMADGQKVAVSRAGVQALKPFTL